MLRCSSRSPLFSIAALASITALASVAGCVPDTGSPSAKNPPVAPDAQAKTAPGAAVGSVVLGVGDARAPTTTAIPDGPPKWKSIPKEQNGFYAVLDGLCSHPGSGGRSEEADTRIRGRWRDRIIFDDPPAPIAKVRWSLLYERVLAVRGPHVTIVSTDPVATGELTFAGTPTR